MLAAKQNMTGCNGRCCESFPMVNGTGRMTLYAIKRIQETLPGSTEYDKYVDMLLVVNPNDGGNLFTCRYYDPVTKRRTELRRAAGPVQRLPVRRCVQALLADAHAVERPRARRPDAIQAILRAPPRVTAVQDTRTRPGAVLREAGRV